MESTVHESIELATAKLKNWQPKEIIIQTRDGSFVDLMDYIGCGPVKKGSWCYFPTNENWNDKNDKKHRRRFVQYVSESCVQAGFYITIESFDSREDRINITCKRGKVHEESSKKKGVRKTVTCKPTCKSDVCPFRFNIHWCEHNQCWGIKAGYGVKCHKGHHKIDPSNVKKMGTTALPQRDFEFCLDALRCNSSPITIQAIAKERCNVYLSTSQIEYWQRLCFGTIEEHSTAAGSLVQMLKDAKDISYVLLYDDPSSNLLRVRKPRKNEVLPQNGQNEVLPQNGNTSQWDAPTLLCTLRNSDGTESTLTPACAIPEQQNVMEYVQRIRRSMCVGNGQKVLLGAAWCSDNERHLVNLFPEVMAADVTEQTNSEKRPLMMLAGLTAERETFTFCRAFLPSQQRWVFDWFFGTAVPFLMPPGTLARNRLMLTDGDEKEYNSFLSSLDKFYPNSCHHLCTWHLLDRGLKKSGIPGLCSQNNMCPEGCLYFDALKHWLKSWFSSLESENEFNHSYQLLQSWLNSTQVTSIMGIHVTELIINFIKVSLIPHKSKWLYAGFLYNRTFDRQSTQIVEVENSVLKRSSNGPKPNHPINKAALSMIIVQDIRNSNKLKKGANSLDRRRTTEIINDLDQYLNDFCVEKLLEQSNMKGSYDVYRNGATSFFVKRKQCSGADVQRTDAYFFVPKYERTRTCSIVTMEGKEYLKCSCGFYERHGFPCRHVYAALDRDPMPYDAIPRYQKNFESLYSRDRAVTELYNRILQNEIPGPPIQESNLLNLPILSSIPEKVTHTLRHLPPVLSTTCKWGCEVQAAIVMEPNSAGIDRVELTGMPGVQTEYGLSQAASEYQGGGQEDQDDEQNINAPDENEINEPDECEMQEEDSTTFLHNRHKNGTTFHHRNTAMFQEYCKMSEWGKEFDAMLEQGMFELFEKCRKMRYEQISKKKKLTGNSEAMVSSHMEGRGPRKAKRLRPAGSPRR